MRRDTPKAHGPAANDRRYVGGWLAVVIAAGFTIIWSLMVYFAIGDRPRDWQYGTTPYVPSESTYSTERAPTGKPPPQVVLPEGG